jgi:hypothetical protein
VTVSGHEAKMRKCRKCQGRFPMGSLVNGECPSCAGLELLPLRGEGGRFVSFNLRAGGDR